MIGIVQQLEGGIKAAQARRRRQRAAYYSRGILSPTPLEDIEAQFRAELVRLATQYLDAPHAFKPCALRAFSRDCKCQCVES